jgi:hypothetical protein
MVSATADSKETNEPTTKTVAPAVEEDIEDFDDAEDDVVNGAGTGARILLPQA